MSTFTEMAEAWIRQHHSPPAETPRGPTVPVVDAYAWAEDFHEWELTQCVYRGRCFGAVRGLHCDFCEWLVARNEGPCTFDTFERLLQQLGFLIADGFVSGLVLRRTLIRSEHYPEVSRTGDADQSQDVTPADQNECQHGSRARTSAS